MRRVFKTRDFARWLRKSALDDAMLRAAVSEMARGLIDARLGGRLVKKRLAVPGRGKRGGARTLVATNLDDRWFFVFGFEKNERADIGPRELAALRMLADDLLGLSTEALNDAVEKSILGEISDD